MDRNIFGSYDIRGIYGSQLTDTTAYRIGKAIFKYLNPRTVALGRDVRLGALAVQNAMTQALLEEGCEVIDLGIISTDMSYFAAGKYDFDVVIQATASHNPKEWIGAKITRQGGLALGGGGEIQELEALMGEEEYSPNPDILNLVKKHLDIEMAWSAHVLSFVDVNTIKPFKIVVDTGNGVGGPMVRDIFRKLPVEIVEMYFEPDGNFPNHLPNPLEPENIAELRSRVVAEGADLGMAFDGDADRFFLVDNKGNIVTGSETTAMVADEILSQDARRVILYNTICGWNVRDVLARHHAIAHRTKVGHGYIKKDMRSFDAYFAGEHSGHYFFKDNYYADSGIIAAMFVLQLLSKRNQSLAEVLAPYRKYVQILETNFVVSDPTVVLQAAAQHYIDGTVDWVDGLTVKYEDFWFNIRPSSNEPLLRLNVEAVNEGVLKTRTEELTQLIAQNSGLVAA